MPHTPASGESAHANERRRVAANVRVGTVGRLWRFPVKSMGGESPMEVELTAHGLLGDRVYALLDLETDKVVNAKRVREFPDLLECRRPTSSHHVPAAIAAGAHFPAERSRGDDRLPRHSPGALSLFRA
jgi:uncharacterized protein YcbX